MQIYANSSSSDKIRAIANNIQVGDLFFASNIYGRVLGPARTQMIANDYNNYVNNNNSATNSSGATTSYLSPVYTYLQSVVDNSGKHADAVKSTFGAIDTYGQAYDALSVASGGNPRPFQTTSSIRNNPWMAGPGISPDMASQQANAWKDLAKGESFPSGHSTFGNTLGISFAMMDPQHFRAFLSSGVEFAYSRNVLGVHYPLDSIAGRIIATYTIAHELDKKSTTGASSQQALNNAASAFSNFFPATSPVCGSGVASVSACVSAGLLNNSANLAAQRARYRYLLTYNLPSVGPTDEPMSVPKEAHHLLDTRFPYLSKKQKNDVLKTTSLPSGAALSSSSNWDRINLFDAAGGYGALTKPTTIIMNATQGGFNALDTWDNDITGVGSLTKAGTGTLALTGANSYSGGTTVAGGVLASLGTLTGSVTVQAGAGFVNAGTLNANGGAIDNAGTFNNLVGATINGSVTNSGSLANDGTINGTLTVTQGGIHTGNGTVGELIVGTGGTLSPGHSIGAIHVLGNLALTPGSTHVAELNPGAADHIHVEGRAQLGGNLEVRSYAGLSSRLGERLEILRAEGGVAGRFSRVSAPHFGTLEAAFPFLAPRLDYGLRSVGLTLSRSDVLFAEVAQTRNQSAVAQAADRLSSGALLTALTSLDRNTAPGAFQTLSGEVHASAVTAQFETGAVVREAVLDRMRWGEVGLRSGDGIGQRFAPGATVPAAFAADPSGRAPIISQVTLPARTPSPFTSWGQGFGSFGATAGNDNAARLTRETGGFVLGGDIRLGDLWRVGVASGYTVTSFDVTGRLSSGSVESGFGALYGSGVVGPVAMRLGFIGSGNNLSTQRSIGFLGLQDNGTARYNGRTFQGFGEVGYQIATGFGLIEPFLGGAAIRIEQDGARENGGSAALTLLGHSNELATSTVGLRAEAQLGSDLLPGIPARLRLLAGWRRAYGDLAPGAFLAFGSGESFLTAGVPVDRDAFVGQAGIDWALTPATSLGFAYGGQIGARAADHSVKGRFSYAF
ncbi:autotransporter domain-containing protein [Methylobacterium sp. E-045]|uniref:autotransporter domain-containing protein n=1 Tax=Methylobacterium sp. E-045 TaxID=2836575 RepID=UPI001FB87A4A|nr:autotransporter domain-containing protein [Methylobacterium sp. E-045]MCJ2127575.1 autotransporter domain-containing protein [Methylobacterium sp. E-045]